MQKDSYINVIHECYLMVKKDVDILQKNIDTVLEFLTKLHHRRSDTIKKLYEMQKQDSEFEKLLQVSLLKLLATTDLTFTKPKLEDVGETPNRAYG